MDVFVVINDEGVETYSQKGLIANANKSKLNKHNLADIKTVKAAKQYLESEGASVWKTDVIKE